MKYLKEECSFYYWGPLLFRTKLHDKQIKALIKLSEEAKLKKIDHRKKLVGVIKKELNIDIPKYTDIVRPALNLFKVVYKNWYPVNHSPNIKNLSTLSAWVNFMKKGEFNPPHSHNKCDFSSVLYLNIPPGLEKERKQFLGTGPGPGSIVFTIGGPQKFYNNLYSFVPEVGDFFIFPYSLIHFVGPFQCSGTRTSIAANFKLET